MRGDACMRVLAQEVIECAIKKGVTISCAESCTGGLICAALTDVAGSSAVFSGGIVSYAVSVKEKLLHVNKDTISQYDVVSSQTAKEMALGARKEFGVTLAVSTTGIAGPGGAKPGKPVGLVYFGLSSPRTLESCSTCRGTSREEVRDYAVETALALLKAELQRL